VTGEGGGEMSLGSGSGSGLAGAGHRSRYEELLESLEILHAVRDLVRGNIVWLWMMHRYDT